ncbi:hypothetical protein FRC06_009572, partial [Ceratobasidium sp. 370]
MTERIVTSSNGIGAVGEGSSGTTCVTPTPTWLRPEHSHSALPIAQQQTESCVVRAAPTRAEFLAQLAKESCALQNARKKVIPDVSMSNKRKNEDGTEEADVDIDADADVDKKTNRVATKGPRKIGTYKPEHQSLMFIMRASLQYDFMGMTNGQLQTAGHDQMKLKVVIYYGLQEGKVGAIESLQLDDVYLYPGGNKVPEDMFNTQLMSRVFVRMYFGTTQRIGYLYMDELLQDDDPEELAALLSTVAESNPDVEEGLTLVDCSPEALCGPSLAAIAFAAVNIYHWLEHLKMSKETKEQADRQKKNKGKKDDKRKKKTTLAPVPGLEFTETRYHD